MLVALILAYIASNIANNWLALMLQAIDNEGGTLVVQVHASYSNEGLLGDRQLCDLQSCGERKPTALPHLVSRQHSVHACLTITPWTSSKMAVSPSPPLSSSTVVCTGCWPRTAEAVQRGR